MVLVLAGFEAEKEGVLLKHVTQAISTTKATICSLKLRQDVEVSAHLLEVRSEQALIGCLRSLLGVVHVMGRLHEWVFKNLSLESRLNYSEKLVQLLISLALFLALSH